MLIYTYGALAPTEGAQIVSDHLHRAHRYQNALIEIERNRRARYREIERSVVSVEAADAVTVAEDAEKTAALACAAARSADGGGDASALAAALKAVRQALKVARATYKVEAAPLRAAAKLVHAARETEKEARKAAHKCNRDDKMIVGLLEASVDPHAELARRLFASDTEAAGAARAARAASGLPWGTYTLVEDAVAQSCKATPGDPLAPRFRRFTGEGRIGAPQIKGGIDIGELVGDARFRVQMTPALSMVYDTRTGKRGERTLIPAGKRHQQARMGTASIRLGTGDDGEPLWATWPLLTHRPLPEGARVKRAWALRRQVGSTYQWEIQITVDESNATPAKMTPLPAAGRAVALDIGWRSTAAWRVGYLVDTDGHCEAIQVPRVRFGHGIHRRKHAGTLDGAPAELMHGSTISEALDYLAGIRAVRDRHFDVARGFMREYLSMIERPPWLVEATTTIHAWKGHGKLVRLWRLWEKAEERISGDDAIVAGLAAWAEKDRHLWDWEAHGRERILRARREHYRVVAARIARTYETIIIPTTDLREFATGPAVEDGPAAEGRPLRKIQRDCASSELREAVKHAAKREGRTLVEKNPAFDTVTCHVCGTIDEWDDPAVLLHVCSGCGNMWDRDQNSCVNRLRSGGFDPSRALRCCIPQGHLSQGTAATEPGAVSSTKTSSSGAAHENLSQTGI